MTITFPTDGVNTIAILITNGEANTGDNVDRELLGTVDVDGLELKA